MVVLLTHFPFPSHSIANSIPKDRQPQAQPVEGSARELVAFRHRPHALRTGGGVELAKNRAQALGDEQSLELPHAEELADAATQSCGKSRESQACQRGEVDRWAARVEIQSGRGEASHERNQSREAVRDVDRRAKYQTANERASRRWSEPRLRLHGQPQEDDDPTVGGEPNGADFPVDGHEHDARDRSQPGAVSSVLQEPAAAAIKGRGRPQLSGVEA